VGYDKNGNAQTAWVQGVTNNGQFTATLIGNDANGNLVDKTTGTGTYTASVNGSGVEFSNNGGQTSSSGVFVNGTPQTTFQDAGWANNNALTGFNFTLTNSKLEADQLEAGTFTFNGTPDQAGAALLKAGFIQHNSSWFEPKFNSYRSPGGFLTGANSGHFNVYQITLNPLSSVPQAQGNMHFGEHNPFSPFGWMPHNRGGKPMIAQRADALWSGWCGTALFVLCWLMISRISALSFSLWIGLMLLGAALCFYGGMRRTKWFLIPAFVALAVTAGIIFSVSRGQ
jgi:hypothetical protein